MKKLTYAILFLISNYINMSLCAGSGDQSIQNLSNNTSLKSYQMLRHFTPDELISYLAQPTSKKISLFEHAAIEPKLRWFINQVITYQCGTPQTLQKIINLALCFKDHQTSFQIFQQLSKHMSPYSIAQYLKKADLSTPHINPNIILKLKSNNALFKIALKKKTQ